MRVELNASVWQYRVDQNGNISIQVSESRKNRDGAYETQNQFWASVRGEEAIAAVKAMESAFEAVKNKTGRPPFMTLTGFEHGRGVKRQDGSYGAGFIVITGVKEFVRQNAAPSASAPAPAPRTAAPVPAPAPTVQNPVPPVSAPTTPGYMNIPDMDEELPFN